MDAMPANSLSTFGGNPLATAGAMANLQYLLDHDLQGNALRVGLVPARAASSAGRPVRDGRRGARPGLMIGIELVEEDGRTPSPRHAAACLEACKAGGVLIGKGGLYGNCLPRRPAAVDLTRRGRRGRGSDRRRRSPRLSGQEGTDE